MDDTYQRQLKEVNELNWARVETRFGAFDERLDANAERFEDKLGAVEVRVHEKLAAFEVRFNEKLAALEVRVNEKLDALDIRFDEKLVALEVRLLSHVDLKIQRLRSEMILWMFGFWTATTIPLAGLMLALSGVFRP